MARSCGGCLIFLGLVLLIALGLYIIKPGLYALEFHETTCRVVRIEDSLMQRCSCRSSALSSCSSQTPCVRVYVTYPELPNHTDPQFMHQTISQLVHAPGCTVVLRRCDATVSRNAQRSLDHVASLGLAVNTTHSCYAHPSKPADVVLEREFSLGSVVHAIVWPVLIILCGCLTVRASSTPVDSDERFSSCTGIGCCRSLSRPQARQTNNRWNRPRIRGPRQNRRPRSHRHATSDRTSVSTSAAPVSSEGLTVSHGFFARYRVRDGDAEAPPFATDHVAGTVMPPQYHSCEDVRGVEDSVPDYADGVELEHFSDMGDMDDLDQYGHPAVLRGELPPSYLEVLGHVAEEGALAEAPPAYTDTTTSTCL
eukprot:m.199035 g.199035  ORF g.199035 m.199035 type:complete len:367 (+) comp18383_c0_seq1:89-1189(+)